jgi:bifunctional UDP-N-acetylglucosamine pyrophosphorylase/glucosamine-1-phosphate N-acetyltransferase
MQAVILAAGLGTRLMPVTARRSKAMVPVLGKPLVERALAPIAANGVRDVVLVVGPGDDEIRHHFDERTSLDVTTRFVVQEHRRGMAHALGLAAPLLDGPFVLSACDSLVSADHWRELLASLRGADAVLSLLDVEPAKVPKSAAVELDEGTVLRIVEKPGIEDAPSHTISLPHYAFPRILLDHLPGVKPSPRGELELQDAIQRLIDTGGRVVGVRSNDRQQVSTPQDLLGLNRRLLRAGDDDGTVAPGRVGRGTRLLPPLRIEGGVAIGDDCELGPDVYLESGCSIGDGVVLRNSLVLRGARVRDGQRVEGEVIS